MAKNIWIINEYAGNPKYGMTLRHFYLAKEFEKLGWKTNTISASFSHILDTYPENKENKNYFEEKIDGLNFTWIKVFKYRNSSDYKRILKWFYFSFRLFFVGKHIGNKPNYIICSPTAPFCFIPAYYLKWKYRAKIVFEVRDIWPLSLIEIGSFSKYHPFILLMRMVEFFAIKKADFLVSNLQFYNKYLEENKQNRKASWISNAIYLEELLNTAPLNQDLVAKLPQNKFIVGYTGKLGISNAMNYLIEAAKLIRQEEIHFVIVGNGEDKEKLKTQAKGLSNITFIDAIPKSQIPAMLAKFDICYIGWNREKLYNYGVSPNKIYDYMHAEKPILHSIHLKEELVSLAQCGLRVEEENPEAIAQGVLDLYKLSPENRLSMGKKGKDFVLKNFTYGELAKRYLNLLESSN